jgi:hypothetical protein
MEDLVAWIEGLLDDCAARAPFGIGWQLDQSELPIRVVVTPADHPAGEMVLSGGDVGARLGFAARLQAFLDVELDSPVPVCQQHRLGLAPVRAGAEVQWRCEQGDFQCRVGHYLDALWPPSPDEEQRRIGPMLSRRLQRRGVAGISGFGVELRDNRWLAKVRLRPEGDEVALRKAAEPVLVEVERVEGIRTVRDRQPATARRPARRRLMIVGAPTRAALLEGLLRRAEAGDGCDFLVGETRVRLAPEHRIGPPGSPLVMDSSGVPFADEGDTVSCGGGFAPNRIRSQTPIFQAGQIAVNE